MSRTKFRQHLPGALETPHRGAEAARSATPLRVVIATPLGEGGRGGMDRLADLVIDQINQVPQGTVLASRLTTKGGRGKLLGVPIFFASVLRLLALCARRQVDVLHINLAAYGSFHRKAILAAIASWFRVPYVVHIHSGRFGQFWNGAGARTGRRIDALMRGSAGIVVLGSTFERLVKERVPDAAHKILTLPNATPGRLSRKAARQPSEPVMITFLGVLCPAKGIPQLVEALGRLAGNDAWTATLAGYGDIEATRQRAIELGISDRVATPGWIDNAAVDRLLQRTDILVLPSFSEGLPMVIIEAFAAGIPVVATPVNAVVDVVRDGENGFLVTPGDVDALTKSLERLVNDDHLRTTMGDTALEDHRSTYEPQAYLRKLTALWRRAGETTAHR